MIQCSCGFGLIPAVEISQVHVYKYCVCESLLPISAKQLNIELILLFAAKYKVQQHTK